MANKGTKQRKAGKKGSALPGAAAQIVKGCIGGIVFTIVMVLLFAFLLKSMALADSVIAPANEGIKLAAVLLTAYLATKKPTGPPWLIGAVSGVVYMVAGFFVFSLLDGGLGLWQILLSDALTGALVGLIGGLLFRTILKRPKQTAYKRA